MIHSTRASLQALPAAATGTRSKAQASARGGLSARNLRCRAETDTTELKGADATAGDAQGNAGNAEGAGGAGDWVPVIEPENLPKGVRKEVTVGDVAVLLFWYRNQIYAISARSPAEGAYSEGFIKAKFTQDYGIICPTSGSVFSLKDGSVVEWFPNNPVLRAIQPKPSPLPIYPVKLEQDAIKVNISLTPQGLATTRGGADSSLESNNVFALQPKVYYEGSEDDTAKNVTPGQVSTILTLTVSIAAFAIAATAGTATALYYDDKVLLGLFWALLLVATGYFALQYFQNRDSE